MRRILLTTFLIFFIIALGQSARAESGYCPNCGGTYEYSDSYESYGGSRAGEQHWVRHWCANCGQDQYAGLGSEGHDIVGGQCTKCGYTEEGSNYCEYCNGYYPYSTSYDSFESGSYRESTEHCVRYTCSNCGVDQNMGFLYEGHEFRRNTCTKCGYTRSGGAGYDDSEYDDSEYDDSEYDTSSHTCSFLLNCTRTHCDVKICYCGAHKNNAPCGGFCNIEGYCSHCFAWYCSICNDHVCSHNRSGYCSEAHCTSRYYCSKCGHSCDGGHNYSSRCSLAHCSGWICSVSGCGEHATGSCGGGHTSGNWEESGDKHIRHCGVYGCAYLVDEHYPFWGKANGQHTSTCARCTLKYTHMPNWTGYYFNGVKHTRDCTVTIGGISCSAIDSHTADWGSYVKSDGGGEDSSASHLKRCNIAGCKLVNYEHTWQNSDIWRAVDDNTHKRICSECGLIQVLNHDFVDRVQISGDDEDSFYKHYKVCTLCVDANDEKYKVEEFHKDFESGGRGNGICDLCNKELWRVSKSIMSPTRNDVEVKVEMYSDYSDKSIYAKSVVNEEGDIYSIGSSGIYTATKNGRYVFNFESPDRDVVVDMDNICKSIYGKVFITPNNATTDEVELELVVSKEGAERRIDVKFEGDAWSVDQLRLAKTISNNGSYTFYARDELGNEATFVANVNNIMSGFASVTTTFDVFQGGYIFTDILVNVNQAWVSDSVVMNYLNSSISCSKVNDEDYTPQNISVNKVFIMNERQEKISGGILSSGSYYFRVAIGGSGMFPSEGTYLIGVQDGMITDGSHDMISLSGKNRIEVIVQSLNDLT